MYTGLGPRLLAHTPCGWLPAPEAVCLAHSRSSAALPLPGLIVAPSVEETGRNNMQTWVHIRT